MEVGQFDNRGDQQLTEYSCITGGTSRAKGAAHLGQVLRQRVAEVAVRFRKAVEYLLTKLDVPRQALGGKPVVEVDSARTHHHLLPTPYPRRGTAVTVGRE